MAYVNNGDERSLRISVYKKVGGNYVQGYPVVYDGQNSWGDPIYPTLTDTELRQLSNSEFNDRYNAFISYVITQEPGINFNTDIVGDGAIRTNTGVCLPTTTTTVAPVWEFDIKYGFWPINACTGTVSKAYSNKQFPGVGDFLYRDSALSEPWNLSNGPAILITNPAIYGTKTILMAVVDTAEYDQGEITDVSNGVDCGSLE